MLKEQKNLLSELTVRMKLLRKVVECMGKLSELHAAAQAAREKVSEASVLDVFDWEPEGLLLETDDDTSIIEAFQRKPIKLSGQVLAKTLFPDELFTALDEYAAQVNAWHKGVVKLRDAVTEVLELDARILAPLNEDDAELVRDRLIQTDFPLCADADEVFVLSNELPALKLDLAYVESLYEEQE